MRLLTGLLIIIILTTSTTLFLFYYNIFHIQDLLHDSCSFGNDVKCGDYNLGNDALKINIISSQKETIALASIGIKGNAYCRQELNGQVFQTGTSVDAQIPCDFSSFVPNTKNRLELEISYYLPRSGPNFQKKINGKIFTEYKNVSISDI